MCVCEGERGIAVGCACVCIGWMWLWVWMCVLCSEAMFGSVVRVCDCFSVSVHVACRLISECIVCLYVCLFDCACLVV